MRHSPVALVSVLMISAAFGQETVTLPAKPANPHAGRVLELREVFRISDAQGGFYFKGPSQIKPSPTADSWSPMRTSSSGSTPRASSSST